MSAWQEGFKAAIKLIHDGNNKGYQRDRPETMTKNAKSDCLAAETKDI
jgi:hypothetical protein